MRKLNSSVLAADTLTPNFKLIGEERHVAVAVSGGPDSMALLLLAKAWCVAHNRRITALHFDHGLRAESSLEAAQVETWCAALGIEFHVRQWLGEKPKTGIQAQARAARYSTLVSLCKDIGAGVLLTGHTVNDQAETYVMRQKRSSSPHALSGIWPEREVDGIRIVRPLLACYKISLIDYLISQNQKWIEDPSNLNPQFERIRVRNGLALSEVNNLAALSATALRTYQDTERHAAQWAASIQCDDYGVVSFDAAPFLALAIEVQDLAFIKVMQRAGRADDVSGSERRNMLDWLTVGTSRNRTLNGLVFQRSSDHYNVFREFGRIDPAPQIVPQSGELLWDQRFLIAAEPGSKILALGLIPNFPRNRDIPADVLRTLPAVNFADGSLCVPHLGHGQGAEIKNKL